MKGNLPACYRENKWDWDLAFALYCGGMTFEQIRKTEWFQGMAPSTLYNYASQANWRDRRGLMRDKVGGAMAQNLTERITQAAETHQSFILDEIEQERLAFKKHPKGIKYQMDRLQILEKLDNVARKTLKLDESKAVDQTQQNFAILVYLQQHTPTDPKGPSLGILRSKNGHIGAGGAVTFDPVEGIQPENGSPGPILDEPIKVLNGYQSDAVNKKTEVAGTNGKPMPFGLFKNAEPIQPQDDPYAIEPADPNSSN